MKKENQLLKKALENKGEIGLSVKKIPLSKEELELCMQHLMGAVSIRQYANALDVTHSGQITQRIPTLLRWGLAEGHLTFELS